jgi:hypothetical protein
VGPAPLNFDVDFDFDYKYFLEAPIPQLCFRNLDTSKWAHGLIEFMEQQTPK